MFCAALPQARCQCTALSRSLSAYFYSSSSAAARTPTQSQQVRAVAELPAPVSRLLWGYVSQAQLVPERFPSRRTCHRGNRQWTGVCGARLRDCGYQRRAPESRHFYRIRRHRAVRARLSHPDARVGFACAAHSKKNRGALMLTRVRRGVTGWGNNDTHVTAWHKSWVPSSAH